MSSGFGLSGGKGRCYDLWLDVVKCSNDVDNGTMTRAQCQVPLSDFVECLHHNRERARLEEIRQELINKNGGNALSRPHRGIVALNQVEG
ncbi:hypothetical protein V1512DRAFT_61833 [Lipomyces arxii]|uniref:uncharacterized protein n=1 Tax=Lipomyces arxii TaxID=56418 RepID=UPI0034CE9165